MSVFLKGEESRGKKRKRGSVGGGEGESEAEPGGEEEEEEEVKTKRLKGRRIIICLGIVIGERSEPA